MSHADTHDITMEEDILESEIDSLEVTGFVKKGHDNVSSVPLVLCGIISQQLLNCATRMYSVCSS